MGIFKIVLFVGFARENGAVGHELILELSRHFTFRVGMNKIELV